MVKRRGYPQEREDGHKNVYTLIVQYREADIPVLDRSLEKVSNLSCLVFKLVFCWIQKIINRKYKSSCIRNLP